MKKLMAVSQLALCCVFVFCNSGDGQTRPSELVGHWVHGSGYNYSNKMELFKDGTGVIDEVTVSWKVEGKRFVIMSSQFGTTCNYKVSGYELTLIFDDGKSTILVKKGKLEDFKAKQEAEKVKQAAAAEVEKAKKIAEGKRALEQLPKFTDSRDNKVYRKVKIGGQTWMAENLNYAANGSVCYENNADNCAKYGRLYNWATAKQACPTGWHLPSDDEWTTLTDNVGGSETAGTKLKSSAGWNENGNGTNEFAFSALPGGYGNSGGSFNGAGYYGYWWSSTEYDAFHAWGRNMNYDDEDVGRDYGVKALLFSVRCVEDDKSEQAFERGTEAYDNKNYDKAISEYSQAIKLNPNNIMAYISRGFVYHDGKEDYDKAIADFSEAIRLNPKDDGAYRVRGLAYTNKENYDKAIADFNESIRLNPKDDVAYSLRGSAYNHKGDFDKAIADYEASLRINPNYELAKKNLEKTKKLIGSGELNISSPNTVKGGALTGGRSRASIQRVVMQNMASLRYAYHRRLRDKPDLAGKITVKFAIDEFGKVIFAQVVESTMDDSELERTVVDKVKSWDFDKIDKPGDVTEVVYPFVFSQ